MSMDQTPVGALSIGINFPAQLLFTRGFFFIKQVGWEVIGDSSVDLLLFFISQCINSVDKPPENELFFSC